VPRATNALKNNKSRTGEADQRQRIEGILRQRERLIVEVQTLSTVEGCAESAKKAQQLLTRWWAKADWKAREELLRVAAWVIRVEAIGRV
jgi:nucleoside recognition membrane protein YjiH